MAPDAVAAGMESKCPDTPASSGINYQVFLNFRGKDTRKGFTSHLYDKLENAGIEVFKDNKNLRAGEEISQTLKDVIKRSRISIAIFSKNYASSKFCLMELEQMRECIRSNEHTLIPIFYDVSPYTVKRQDEDFAKSFENHKEVYKVDANIIKNWRDILQHVGGLSGFELEQERDEVSLLKKVLERVEEVLNEDEQNVPDKLFGIGRCVHEMMTKLGVVYSHGEAMKVCGEGVRVVGICGLLGVGKTTLAQVVYKKIRKSFNRHSFLDLKNSKVSPKLLIAELQKKKHDPGRRIGSNCIKNIFNNMKALIVLDNVHNNEQIKEVAGYFSWLGQESRIIVTTDNRNVFEVFENVAVEEYEVKPMGNYHAYQLFCKHAFQGDGDDRKYYDLSRDIVKALGGLPMAIVLRANFLNKNKKIEKWTEIRDRLRDDLRESKVEAAFEDIYDKFLCGSAKEIFLDIACFFNGKDERIPSYMWWDACGSDPSTGIEKLRDMHLLEDGEHNELKMHNLVRGFGKKIVEGNVLQKRCRIWKIRDACSILKDVRPNESVEGISLTVEEGRPVRFTCEALSKKSNLRYLRLDEANSEGTSENLHSNLSWLTLEEGDIEGKSKNLLPNLRWLDWHTYRFIPELCHMDLKELLILDLSRSPVTRYALVWKQIMEKAKELKVLNLQGCNLLKASLKSSASTGLEILIMEKCTRSPALGAFISKLDGLKSLNLRKCSGVQLLIQQLHGKKALTELLIDKTDVEEIHIENDSLNDLKVLSARECKKLKDIYPIGHLTKLTRLALDGAINWHPETFEFPQNLQILSLRNCPMFKELPLSIGNLGLLEVIDLSDTKIMELPESVKKLTNLRTLKMERTHLQKFPEDIAKLEKLEEIDFSGCKNLEAKDSFDISGLSSLRILKLSSSNVARLPQGIRDLSCLQTLDVGKCDRLQALPDLPSSLVTLCWGSKIMEAPELTKLTNLQQLCLNADKQPEEGSSDQTPDIGWIMGLPSLETLELSLPNVNNLLGDFRALSHLWQLTLSYMEELDLSQLSSFSSLWILRLKRCKIQEPNFSGLISVSELELDDCDLAKIDGLKDLQNLEVLKIFQHRRISDLNGLIYLPRLRKVQVFSSALASLPKLSKRVELDLCVPTSSESEA